MADYGVFSDELPLFLGQEKLMIFERKIALRDIKEEWRSNTGAATRNYKRILLGSSGNTYMVFADYKSNFDFFSVWSGGGFNLPGAGLPNISDSIFMAGKTDNSLLLENGHWYLLAFSPEWAAQNPEVLDTDFYVYRTVDTSAVTDNYGLNVYRSDGSLAYHSGWNLVRARNVYHNIPRVSSQGLRYNGFAMWRRSMTPSPSMVKIEDMQAAGRSLNVGEGKLVSIGHVFHGANYWDKYQREFVRFAPYLKNGLLGYAVAFASCGFTPPDDAKQVAALMGYPTGNPIIVIDKPRI